MNIVIYSEGYEENIDNFIYTIIPNTLYIEFKNHIDTNRLAAIDKVFDINSYKALLLAFQRLLITKIGSNKYIIGFNNNLIIGNKNLGLVLNMILNGNREVKGYPIANEILKAVQDHIDYIYERYRSGNLVL